MFEAGHMVAWDGRTVAWGTISMLARGFAVVRMRTNRVEIREEEWLLPGGWAANEVCTTEPVRLLCRALRMAPPCYRRLEWAAAAADAPLQVKVRGNTASFSSIAELAAAVRLGAAEENIDVYLPPDEGSIVMSRAHAELPVRTTAEQNSTGSSDEG